MLRETMMSTIPVAMIAIEVLCTERFQRLRAVKNAPPDRMWNAIQIAASDTIRPTSRVSTSVDCSAVRHDDRAGGGVPPVTAEASGTSTVVMETPPGL